MPRFGNTANASLRLARDDCSAELIGLVTQRDFEAAVADAK
jgi:hypothetical protein